VIIIAKAVRWRVTNRCDLPGDEESEALAPSCRRGWDDSCQCAKPRTRGVFLMMPPRVVAPLELIIGDDEGVARLPGACTRDTARCPCGES